MALFDLEFPEDFMSDLLDCDCDELCKEMLQEASPIYVDSMKKSMTQVIEHEGDSEMVQSVKASKPKRSRTDAYITNVGPSGYSKEKKYYGTDGKGRKTSRQYPVSNALKAIWKEYGIPGQQSAQPFLANAKNNAEEQTMSKMQEVYNRKVGAKV